MLIHIVLPKQYWTSRPTNHCLPSQCSHHFSITMLPPFLPYSDRRIPIASSDPTTRCPQDPYHCLPYNGVDGTDHPTGQGPEGFNKGAILQKLPWDQSSYSRSSKTQQHKQQAPRPSTKLSANTTNHPPTRAHQVTKTIT
jgi:hypothetical protein